MSVEPPQQQQVPSPGGGARGGPPPSGGGPREQEPAARGGPPPAGGGGGRPPQQAGSRAGPPQRGDPYGPPPGGGQRDERQPPAGGHRDERQPLKRDLRKDEEYQAIGHDYPTYDEDDDYDRRAEAVKDVSALHHAIFWMSRLLLAPACSALIILVGVAQWYEYITIEHLNLSEYVIASYLIFFGLLFLVCELTDFGLRTYLGLLFTYTGRGLSYIFCGSLCFGMAQERFWPLGMAVGFSLLGVGVILVFAGWIFSDLPPLDPWCCSTATFLGKDDKSKKRYESDY